MYRFIFKRTIDFLVSLIALSLLSPVFVVISVLLLIANRGKVFFVQERPGYLERPFFVLKFKTMNDAKDADGNLQPTHIRTTKVGAFLRKFSLDEIPQLLNVLIGDMSLIGPRPLLFRYIPLYSPEQRKRHQVRPGITGLAQVNGRNSITWTKKFEYDIYYVEHLSFVMDLRILFMTIKKVLRSEGVNQSETVTSQPFNGSN